jgi:hypothetical protein
VAFETGVSLRPMTTSDRDWAARKISAEAYAALAQGLPASEVWSLLLKAIEQRARQRTPAQLLQQWNSDRFVQPAYVDQRTLTALDGHLLAAASAFEALELSPLAPLGTCSAVALTSQNRIVSTVRGSEVVSDPTNVLALESARRLRANPAQTVKLATCHRCVRAQEVPKGPGYAAHFRVFCLASAGHERKDQAFVTDALVEHIKTHLGSLDRLAQHGYVFPDRRVKILASPQREPLAQRIAAALAGVASVVEPLDHDYYDGLRFMIDVGNSTNAGIPLVDGGAFNWLQKLTSNRKLVFVASGMGAQLVAHLFRAQPSSA